MNQNMTRLDPAPFIRMHLVAILFAISGCSVIADPEDSGGEIMAVPDGPWCEFNLSADGAWLQYIGDYSVYHPAEQRHVPHQRQAWFVNLDSGESQPATPDPQVAEMIRAGHGPDGLGCFSPDNSRVYYSRVFFPTGRAGDTVRQHGTESRPGVSMSAPGRQLQRHYYMVDLTQSPLTVTRTDQAECGDTDPPPVRPDIRAEQVSNRQVRLTSSAGTLLGEHRPRGWTSQRISVWELDSRQWEQSYSLSPDGRHLAYKVYETGRIGFSAPTHGYLADLHTTVENSARFLAASVYSMKWSSRNHLFACTSHTAHRNSIARWIP
ncbi:MAG: hypothetical protein JJU06_11560 [Ectothiorhodospiraceae bacterium]|nr:hypothetical protein [Ectothiorhodospiraceae bacterium]MCH8503388.1 hypothetical protein [Ectothiorhodospiraceae bacterium]